MVTDHNPWRDALVAEYKARGGGGHADEIGPAEILGFVLRVVAAAASHEAQDGLLSQAQDEMERLRAELAEVQRPLDAQMARLNENLTAANARIAELEAKLAATQDLARLWY